jgi:hypothetical protein
MAWIFGNIRAMAKGAAVPKVATEFRRKERVKALDDLPGVPQGTEGRVLLVDGFTWTRYRVAFDNGRDLGTIDGTHLSRAREYEAALELRETAALQESVVATNGAVADEAEASTGEGAVVNGVTVPAHLLERSKRARERLAPAS